MFRTRLDTGHVNSVFWLCFFLLNYAFSQFFYFTGKSCVNISQVLGAFFKLSFCCCFAAWPVCFYNCGELKQNASSSWLCCYDVQKQVRPKRKDRTSGQKWKPCLQLTLIPTGFWICRNVTAASQRSQRKGGDFICPDCFSHSNLDMHTAAREIIVDYSFSLALEIFLIRILSF